MRKLWLILALLLLSPPAWGQAACTRAAIASAVSAATNGQTVTVSAGSTSFTSAVDIPNTKYITVDGSAGCTITNSPAFTVEPSTAGETRITGFTFTGPGGNPPSTSVYFQNTSTSTSTWRLDHNTFNNASGGTYIAVSGLGPGLMDHNTIQAAPASEPIHLLAAGPGSNAGWTDNITPGGPLMVFIEDNTFTVSSSSNFCSAVEGYYGSRMVFRHNTMNFCQVDQHGTAGAVGVRWYEIYDNTFNVPSGFNQCCVVVLRAGAGVVWGNTKTGSGTLASSTAMQVSEEDTGPWPLAYQVGSGINGYTDAHNSCPGPLNTAPSYFWGNAAALGTVSNAGSRTCTGAGGGNCVQLNRDYFTPGSQPASMHWEEASGDTCSTTYTYVPYTYPHPLVGPTTFVVTVTNAGTGSGTVTSSPAGINCPGTCSATFTVPTTVTLTAAAGGSSTFAGWSGGGCSGTGTCVVTTAASVTATFTANTQLAAPTFSPTGPGPFTTTQTVTITCPAGATCGYTTDGSTPTGSAGTITHGTVYTTPFSVAVNTTANALATESGFINSNIGSATYQFQGSAPAFSLTAGTYTGSQTSTCSQAQSLKP